MPVYVLATPGVSPYSVDFKRLTPQFEAPYRGSTRRGNTITNGFLLLRGQPLLLRLEPRQFLAVHRGRDPLPVLRDQIVKLLGERDFHALPDRFFEDAGDN